MASKNKNLKFLPAAALLKFACFEVPIKCKWCAIMMHDGSARNIRVVERKIDIYVFIKMWNVRSGTTFVVP